MLDLLPDYIAIRILERGHYFSCTQDMSQSEIIDVVFAYDNMVYAPTKEAASQVELEVFKSPAYISAREEYESLLKQYAEIDPSVEELSSARLELKGKVDAIAKHLEGLVALEKKEVFERIEAEYLAQWDEIDKKRLDKAQAAYDEKQSAANSQG